MAGVISYLWTVDWEAQGRNVEEFRYFERSFALVGAGPAAPGGLS